MAKIDLERSDEHGINGTLADLNLLETLSNEV